MKPTPTNGPPAPTPVVPYVAAKAPQPTPLPIPDGRFLEQRVVITTLVTPTAGLQSAEEEMMIDLTETRTHGPTPVPYLYDYKGDGGRLNDYDYVGYNDRQQLVLTAEGRERRRNDPPKPKPGSRPVPPVARVKETATPTT